MTAKRPFFQPPLENYSRKGLLSGRAAMALALARKLELLELPLPGGGTTRFAQVFQSWAEYESRYIAQSACVLPGAWQYADARLTPTLLRDTWEPKGRIGWGLYKTNEIVCDFDIQVRAPTDPERDVMIRGIEDAWLAEEVLLDHVAGDRNGVVIPLPEYWGLPAEFTLQSGRNLDDANSVMRGQREADITVRGRVPQVVCRPVRPMRVKIRVEAV